MLLVGQRAERGAIERRAAIARDQHMRDKAVAITLERLAQHLHVQCQARLGRGDVAKSGQPINPGGRVGDGRSGGIRRAEQRLLTSRSDGIAGEIVEAGQRRQACCHRHLRARFGWSGLPFRSLDAHGGRPGDRDR